MMKPVGSRLCQIAESEGDTNLTTRRAEWQARRIAPTTKALLARDEAAFLHQSVSTPCLNAVARAEGIWIEDVAGRRYMDFHGNNVHHIGYGHPRLKAAIAAQMDALPFAPRRFTCEPAVALAEKLTAIAPGDLSKVLFTTGGSDAVEVALKVARAATGRFKTISFWESFHGAGFGAASVGGEQLFRSGPIGPLLTGTEHVPPIGCYRDRFGAGHRFDEPHTAECGRALAELVDYTLKVQGDVAAVIAEPMRAVPEIAAPGFWQAVRRSCDETGTLLVFDEIPTGLGRTGRLFASEHEGVVPDILVLGKGLGGGALPVAAVVADPSLDVGGDWAFGHYTHEKNPLMARAALTTLEIIAEEGLVERSAALGAPALAERVLYGSLQRGLSFKTTMGNVLTLSPALVITESQLDEAFDTLDAAF